MAPFIFRSSEPLNDPVPSSLLIAGTRPGFKPERVTHKLAEKIEYITTTPVDISSSDIRRKIKQGAGREELVKLMPEKVTDYILQNNLYR